MPTIYTAILGDYEALKEPMIITPGWKYICFTEQEFKSSVWEIRKIESGFPRQTARNIKILFHAHIDDEDSIWIDGSFTINCDLTMWWNKHFQPDITCIRHPVRNCIYEEAHACVISQRGGTDRIGRQITDYKKIIPANAGLIQSGLLMRRKTNFTMKLCDDWYHELCNYSLRDQISFTKVAYQQPVNYITWDYRKATEFIYRKHAITTRNF